MFIIGPHVQANTSEVLAAADMLKLQKDKNMKSNLIHLTVWP